MVHPEYLDSLLDTCCQTPDPILGFVNQVVEIECRFPLQFRSLSACVALLWQHWLQVIRGHIQSPGEASLALAAAAWVLSRRLALVRLAPAGSGDSKSMTRDSDSEAEEFSPIDGNESPHHAAAKLRFVGQRERLWAEATPVSADTNVTSQQMLEDARAEEEAEFGECITRGSDFWHAGVASWSDIEACESGESCPPTPVHRPWKRVRGVRRPKYGTCCLCGVANRLTVPRSGFHQGRAYIRCKNFWVFDSQHKRLCWQGHRYAGDPEQLPDPRNEALAA